MSTAATQDVQQYKPVLSSIMTHFVDGLLAIGVHYCLHYGRGCEAQSCVLSLSIHSEIAPSRLQVHREPISLISLNSLNVRVVDNPFLDNSLELLIIVLGLLQTGGSNMYERHMVSSAWSKRLGGCNDSTAGI